MDKAAFANLQPNVGLQASSKCSPEDATADEIKAYLVELSNKITKQLVVVRDLSDPVLHHMTADFYCESDLGARRPPTKTLKEFFAQCEHMYTYWPERTADIVDCQAELQPDKGTAVVYQTFRAVGFQGAIQKETVAYLHWRYSSMNGWEFWKNLYMTAATVAGFAI